MVIGSTRVTIMVHMRARVANFQPQIMPNHKKRKILRGQYVQCAATSTFQTLTFKCQTSHRKRSLSSPCRTPRTNQHLRRIMMALECDGSVDTKERNKFCEPPKFHVRFAQHLTTVLSMYLLVCNESLINLPNAMSRHNFKTPSNVT